MRKIQIPQKWLCSGSGITTFIHGTGREKVFVRGAIVFPCLKEDLTYTGTLCIAGIYESDQHVLILEMRHFTDYNDILSIHFTMFYDRYGVTDYYYNADSDGDFEAKKFMIARDAREYAERDKVYPNLLKLSVGTDYQAFSLMRQKNALGKFTFKSKMLADALMSWEETVPFRKAPCELQCACIALVGICNDAWESFEQEKQLEAERMDSGIFGEIFDD